MRRECRPVDGPLAKSMPGSLSCTLSTATFDVPGLPLPVAVRRYRSAKGLKLRVDAHAGLIRLSMPCRMARGAALRWAGGQGAWVAEQLRVFVDLNPEFETPVERLATWLARLDDDDEE